MPVCEPLLAWYDAVRRDLPWRHTRDPYRIWLSEIMLQQTRTETVKAYYARFLTLFPTVADLARAPQEQVLKAWEGLGYYSRARNLQKAAQAVMESHGGAFPASYEGILSLPGVGPYTAGAVGSIAFGLRVPAVDGNVYRVASRFYGVREDVGRPDVQRRIRERVTADLPAERPGDYNQALMELGATLCHPGEPDCASCPWHDLCDAAGEGDAALLGSCYRSCLTLAAERGLGSLAFCCVSTGEYGYPNEEAARIAVAEAEKFLSQRGPSIKVIFNVFKQIDYDIYKELLGRP